MAYNEHYKEAFSDAVLELAGSQKRSLLKELVGHESKKGEAVFLDAIGPDDDADTTLLSATKNRERYEEIESPDLDDWLDLQTPHMNMNKQRTLCLPRRIDWGFHFNKENEIAEIADSKSNTLRGGMARVWKGEDALVLTALSAATVSRGRNLGALSSVSMPASQQITITTGEAVEDIEKNMFALILEKFEEQYTANERVFVAMSPAAKRRLIMNSGDKLESKDFITSVRTLETGQLPDIYGAHAVVVPALKVTEGEDETIYAWTEFGVTWNLFDPFIQEIGKSADQRFHWVAYMEEFAGCVRVDDLRCLQITVTGAGS